MTAASSSNRFFGAMAWILLLLVIGGFGAVQLFAPEMASPIRPTLVLHAALFFSWYLLLVSQPRLIASKNLKLHMQIGKASIALAIAMVVTGLVVIREAYLRPGWSIAEMSPQASIMFPLTDMIFFPLAYGLALANRRNPEAHKRFMLFAGLIMIDPATSRMAGAFDLSPAVISLIEFGLVLAVMIYDRRTLGRVHRATWIGAALIVLTYPAVFGLAQTEEWNLGVINVLGATPAG